MVNNISLEGGGVYVESGTVVIEDDSHIDGNWAEVSGGGIAQIGGTIRVSSSTIQDNSMLELLSIPNSTSTDSKRRGAGIYTTGASFILESESLLKNNKGATLGSGLFSDSTVQILSGSIVSNNGGQLQGSSIVSSQGGGIFNLGVLSLVDSKVEKNLGHEGAGIYNLTPGKLDVIRSSVSENNLEIYPLTAGAGIYNENGITKIESSTVSKNEGVHDAGGVYNYGLNAHLIISNSTFQGNWAVTTGGGVRNDSGTVEVYNTLFLENFTPYASSGFGGGIYHRGQNVLLGRLASKIELYAAVNTTQTSLHVNNVDSLLPLPLPINVRLNSEVMRIVAIDRVKGTVQVERTAGQTHSVTTPLELVDYIGLRELDTLGNNKFPLDIVIDNEVMRATSIIPGTNWVAVERGRQNTEIESHDTGALVHGISGSLTIANSTFSDNFSGVGGTSSDIVNYGGVIHSQIHPYVRPTVIESSTLVGNHRAETAAIFTEMLREDFPGKVLTPSGSFLQLNPVPKESTGVIPVWKSITDTLYLSNSVIADGSDKAIMGQVQSGGNNVVDQDKVQTIPILGTISSTATTIELDSYLPTLEKTLASTLYWTPNSVAPFFPFQYPTSAHLPFKIKVSHTQIDPAGNSITVSETMRVTSVNGSLLTVERGIDGTTALAHTGKVTAKINASGLWKSTDVVGAENQIEKSATTLLAPGGLTATADLLQVADSSRLPPVPFSVKVSYVIDNELLWEEMTVTEVVGNYLRVTRDSGVTHPHLSKVVVFSTIQYSIDAKIQSLAQTATDLYTHIPNADSPAAKLAAPTVQSTPLQSGLAADYHPSFEVYLSTSTVSGNYTLSTTLDSESTTLFLKETGLSLSLPAFAKLDQEIIRLVQYSSATQSYVIERGLQGTEKQPHQANSRVTLGTLISADATDTSFSVTLKSPLPPVPFIVAVGGELMNVTAVNAETGIVQVQRGQFGSTRTTHPPLRRASTELTLNTEVIMSVTLGNNLGKASPLYRPWKATLTAEINAQSQYIMVDSPPAAFEDYVAIDGEIFSVIRVPSDASKLRIISRGAFGSPTKNHSVGKMVEAGVVLALDPTVDATITAGSIVTRDGESMIVSAVFDDAMIVTRGANGTKAIDHPLSGSFNFGSSVDADDQYLLVRDSSTIKSFPAIAMVGNERILILEDLGYGILRVQRGIHGTTANPIISGMKAASGTLIQVGSSQLEIGSTIQVEQEQMQVRGFHSSSGLAVVERGTNGTLPASHQAGTFVHFGSASRPIALAGLYTSLTTSVTQASQTSITVGELVEFPATPFFAALGNERIRVDAVVRNSDGTATLQTVRNLDGNVGTAYATGTNLVLLVDQNQWNRLKKATDPIYATPEIGSNATSRFVVNTTSDLVDLSPGDGLVTTSVPGAVSLRAAIMEANALSQPVEIRLSGATYTLTSELEIRGDITLIGTSPSGTIVHGNGQRIFKVLPNARLKLDSLTLTGANSSVQGGAMLITGGSTEINRTIFSANSASSGGAIAITGGTLTIAQSTFMNNTASTDGGALASLGGQTILSYTTFSANSATGKGGAIYNATAGEIELRNTTLAYNQSAAGAGIHNVGKAKVGNSIIANQAYGQTDIKGTFTSLGSNIIGLTSSDVMLTSFVSSTSTTISLSNTQNLPAFPFSLRIGNETMTATSQSGSTFTVQRTNPLSHSPYQSVRLDGFWQTGDQTGSGYTAIDPKLQPLALGLGTVPTHALQSNSPAINAGNAALRLLHEVTVAESETTEFAGFQRDFKVIKVTEAATLPATPFFVQIGTETLEVIAKKGNTLTVKERKFPQPHARGAVVKVLTDARGLPSNNDIGAVELETTISLSTANASLTEDASGIGSQFTYTITRGGNVADRHEIYFLVNPSPNSRITPTDFGSDAFPMGKVIFEPGATSASFTISVASDTVVEPNEAFTVSILSPSAQVRKLVSNVTSTIVDNDTTSVTTTAVTAVEGESLRYIVTLQGNVQGGLQLPWSLGASGDLATLADNDYIASSGVLNFVGTQGEKQFIEAITLQDQKVERHESLSVTIGTNLGVSPEMVSRISVPATLVGTIQNDDRTTIYISEVSKTELHSGSATVSSGFTVWPNPVDTSLPLTLQVTSSDATLGSDYSVSTSTLTLPGTIGTQSSNVVSIVGDNTLETDEVVQIAATLTDRNAWSSFISVVSGKVTIIDDDGPTLAISDVIASESNSAGYIEFQVQLLNNNGNPLTIDLKTKNGTAIAGEDYQQTTRTLSFSGTSGETLTFQVPLLSDNKVELDESLSLEPVDPLALSGAGIRLRSGVGTIRNDDVANIEISPPISIHDKAWLFEVRLSNPVDVPVTVTMNSTEIMASPTAHFTPSTTTFSLMTTSDVGRLVVDYHPQVEAARNIQVAPVSVASSGRNVNLSQSQNATIPVHQANVAACRPTSVDPLAPPPNLQFSGPVPSGYLPAGEINGILIYEKPDGRTVASYEQDKISQFRELHDGRLQDETGFIWDRFNKVNGNYHLSYWDEFTVQKNPPPPGQPNAPGCPGTPPTTNDEEIDEDLLKKELAKSDVKADWVIPHNQTFTFSPFPSFDFNKASDVGVTITDSNKNLVKVGATAELTYGTITVNADNTLTYTPKSDLTTNSQNRLKPEVDNFGNVYRFTGIEGFTAHLVSPQYIAAGSTATTVESFASTPITLAISNNLPTVRGTHLRQSREADQTDEIFIERNTTLQVDLESLYSDLDGAPDLSRIKVVDVTYNQEKLNNPSGNQQDPHPTQIRIPIATNGQSGTNEIQRSLIVSRTPEAGGPKTLLLIQNEVDSEMISGSFPKRITLTVHLTDGTTMEVTKDDGTKEVVPFVWKLNLNVVPHVDQTVGLWRNQPSIPVLETTPWVRKVSPSILERYKAETKETQPNRFEVTATVPTLDAAFQYDTIGDASVNLFNGTLLRSHELILDGSGGTSEMALGGLIYDSSTVPTASPSEQTNNLVIAKFKKSSDQVLTSLTFKLKWYDEQGLIETNVSVAAAVLSQPEIIVALRPGRVPTKSGLYSWEVETKAEYAVDADKLPVEIQIARGQSPVVVVGENSNFGAGWALAGMPTLTLSKGFDLAGGINSKSLDDRFLLHFPGSPPALFNAASLALTTSYEGALDSIDYGSLGIGPSIRQRGEYGSLTSRAQGAEIVYRSADGTEYVFSRVSDTFNLVRIEPPGVEYSATDWGGNTFRRGLAFTWEQPGSGNPSRLKSIISSDGVETTLTYDPQNHVSKISRDTKYQVALTYNTNRLEEIKNLASGSTTATVQTLRHFDYNPQGQLVADQWWDLRPTTPKLDATTSFGYEAGFLREVQVGSAFSGTSFGLAPHKIEPALSKIAMNAKSALEFYSKSYQEIDDLQKLKTAFPLTVEGAATIYQTENHYSLEGLLIKSTSTVNDGDALINTWSYTPQGDVSRSVNSKGQTSYFWYDYQSPYAINSTTDPSTEQDKSPTYDQNDFFGNITVALSLQGLSYFYYETDDETGSALGGLIGTNTNPFIQGTTQKFKAGPYFQADGHYALLNDGRTWLSQAVRGNKDETPTAPNQEIPTPPTNIPEQDAIEISQFDANGYLEKQIDVNGLETTFTYLNRRLKTSTTYDQKSRNQLITSYEYDTFGFIDTITVSRKYPTTNLKKTDYDYDAFGNLLRVETTVWNNPEDSTDTTIAGRTTYRYNSQGQLIWQGETIALAVFFIPELLLESEYVYNDAGLLQQSTIGKNAGFLPEFGNFVNLQQVTTYSYYKDGSLKSEILPTGVEVRYLVAPAERKAWTTMSGVAGASTIDSTGHVQMKLDQYSITERVVDSFGRTVSEANLLTGALTQFIYDDPRTDSPTTIKQRVVNSTTGPSQERETRIQYDSSGRALRQKTNLLAASTTSYDQLGNVAWATTFNDKAATSRYETLPNGLVANVTEFYLDGLGSLSLFVTSFEYDESGRLKKTVDPLMGNSYSNGGALAYEPNTTPAAVYYEINGPLTRITSKTRDGEETVTWQNSLGQTLKSMSPLGAETTFNYDVRGQLISSKLIPSENSTNNSEPGAKGYETNHVFDALGRLRITTVSSGSSILETSYTDYLPPSAVWTVVTTDGKTGLTTASKVDSLGQTVAVLGASGSGSKDPAFPSALSLLSYFYDGASGKTTTVHTSTIGSALTSSAPTAPNNYAYLLEEKHITNSTGNLLSSGVKSGQVTDYQPVQSITYNLAGRPISQTQYGVTTVLGYDNTKSGSDQVWSTSTVGVDPTYRKYDSRGQQVWISDSQNFDSPDTIRWSYDGLGRVTSESVLNGIKEVPRLWTYEGNTVVYKNRNGWTTTTTTDIENKTITETSMHPTNGPQNTPLTFSQVTELYSTGSIAGLSNKEGTTQLADYQYKYDALGRVRNQTSELGTVSGKTLSFDYVYASYHATDKTWETTRTIKETTRTPNLNEKELISTKTFTNALGQVTKIRETATSASQLNSKSVDFLFNGGMLEEIKRYNNGSGTGTAVSNTPMKYNANRKVSEITHYAHGTAENVSKQEIRYTPDGRIQDVSNKEGSNPKRTLTNTRNQDGSVGKVSTSIDESSAAQKEKEIIYNSDAMVSGKKEFLGQIKEDGNGRYIYDKEGNVVEHQRFKTPGNGTLKIASSSSSKLGEEGFIYDTFLAVENAPTGIAVGNYRLHLTPLRIESPIPLADVRITINVVESIPNLTDSSLLFRTYTIPVVKIAENTYAVVEPESWDLTIPSAEHNFYLKFQLDLNVTEIDASFRVLGSLSLDRFHDKHVYRYDAKNRIIESTQIDAGNPNPRTISTVQYKYDALGQLISRKVFSTDRVLDESTFVYEQGNPVLEYDDADRVERSSLYSQNIDLLLATDDIDFDDIGTPTIAETIWVHSDYQGTVTGLYVSGKPYQAVTYDDYGRPPESTSEVFNDNNFYEIVRSGYMGMYYDIDTDLYLDGTRPYDAASARYITSSSLYGGVNYIYSFANNTPVDRTTAAVNFDLNSSTPSFWDFYSDIASHNAQRARDLGDKHASMYRRYLNRIADNGGGFYFAYHAEIGAKTINFASSIASIFIDPSGFLNGVYEQGAKYNRAGGGGINGSVLAVSGTLGLAGLAESIWGVDILTAEALNGDERFDRGMFGVSAALTLAGSPGLFASGRSLLAQAGKMGPKINLVPKSLSTNFSKLSNRVAQTVGKWQNGNAPNRATRFRGEPFAFGTGTRDARVAALMDEASRASGVNLADLVDELRYVQGSSYFDVVGGKRVLAIGSDAFGKTRLGQLIEGAHEIGHAQTFDKLVRAKGFAAAEQEYFSLQRSFGTPLYGREEAIVERLARWRVRKHLGGLTPQQEAASTKYINGWWSVWTGKP